MPQFLSSSRLLPMLPLAKPRAKGAQLVQPGQFSLLRDRAGLSKVDLEGQAESSTENSHKYLVAYTL